MSPLSYYPAAESSAAGRFAVSAATVRHPLGLAQACAYASPQASGNGSFDRVARSCTSSSLLASPLGIPLPTVSK
jgi:hypothetical protein